MPCTNWLDSARPSAVTTSSGARGTVDRIESRRAPACKPVRTGDGVERIAVGNVRVRQRESRAAIAQWLCIAAIAPRHSRTKASSAPSVARCPVSTNCSDASRRHAPAIRAALLAFHSPLTTTAAPMPGGCCDRSRRRWHCAISVLPCESIPEKSCAAARSRNRDLRVRIGLQPQRLRKNRPMILMTGNAQCAPRIHDLRRPSGRIVLHDLEFEASQRFVVADDFDDAGLLLVAQIDSRSRSNRSVAIRRRPRPRRADERRNQVKRRRAAATVPAESVLLACMARGPASGRGFDPRHQAFERKRNLRRPEAVAVMLVEQRSAGARQIRHRGLPDRLPTPAPQSRLCTGLSHMRARKREVAASARPVHR